MLLSPWWQRIGRVLLAPRCLVCAEAGAGGLDLCRWCRAELPWNACACRRCALPLSEGMDCPRCLVEAPPFSFAHAAFRYEFPLDRLLPRFKFHADLAAGELLATLLHWSLDPAQWPQALLPVPLHRSRLRRRGYDQALELAKSLSRLTRLPLLSARLQRVRRTQAQTELGASARRRNVAGECAHLLLDAGVERVDLWAVASAP